jgi:hypothetical protein
MLLAPPAKFSQATEKIRIHAAQKDPIGARFSLFVFVVLVRPSTSTISMIRYNFILHLSSFILTPSSLILPPSCFPNVRLFHQRVVEKCQMQAAQKDPRGEARDKSTSGGVLNSTLELGD